MAILGFEESIIISAVLRHKLEPGDRLAVLKPRDHEDNRAEAAEKRLKEFVQQVGVGKPWLKLSIMSLSEHELKKTVLELVSFLHNESMKSEVVIEISGGLRILCLALVLASMIANDRLRGVYSVTEHTRKLIRLPMLRVRPRLSPALQELMETVVQIKLPSLEQLATRLDKDLSTISRQVTRLVELGLLTREGSRPTLVKPTLLGEALRIIRSQ